MTDRDETLADDRGRPIRFGAWGTLLDRRNPSREMRGLRWRLFSRPSVLGGVLIGVSIGLGMATASAAGFVAGVTSAIGLGVAVAVGLLVVRPLLRRPPSGRQGRRAVDLIVENGICAQCGSSIAGITASDDGFVVCPECRAAWRRPHPPGARAVGGPEHGEGRLHWPRHVET